MLSINKKQDKQDLLETFLVVLFVWKVVHADHGIFKMHWTLLLDKEERVLLLHIDTNKWNNVMINHLLSSERNLQIDANYHVFHANCAHNTHSRAAVDICYTWNGALMKFMH